MKGEDMLKKRDFDDAAVAGEGPAELISVQENGWIGFTDKYWMTTLAPAPGQSFTAVVKYAPGADIYQTETRMPVQTAAPGATVTSRGIISAVEDCLKQASASRIRPSSSPSRPGKAATRSPIRNSSTKCASTRSTA